MRNVQKILKKFLRISWENFKHFYWEFDRNFEKIFEDYEKFRENFAVISKTFSTIFIKFLTITENFVQI